MKPASYVALLRGVNNAGPSTRVAMADLRGLFESMGFGDVRTLLNSGNVVFSIAGPVKGLAERIEKALASELAVPCAVCVLSAREIAGIVRGNPLARRATDPSRLLVMVPRAAGDLARVEPLLARRWSPEALALGPRAAYLWCANGVARSPIWMSVDRALDRSGTVRNIATFTKVLAAMEAATPA